MRHKILAALLALWPFGAFAGTILECELVANSAAGWISPVMFLETESDYSKINVIDVYTNDYSGGWIAARVTSHSPERVRFEWTVKNIPLSNRRLKVSANYQATYTPRTGKLRLAVYLLGVDMDPPRGTGKCKPSKKRK
ncbi:hypothetical protein LCL97_15995 [Seohaeicola saemankumensis]|nr:hypothetical protein [Seohaeicola saemankumensis]MCA0872338.1 hypothetical protein [Seohaeicola saemankumensis]